VQTASKISVWNYRENKRTNIIVYKTAKSNHRIYRSTLIPPNETIYTQHGCASTYVLYVHKVHWISPAYNIEPTALHYMWKF
jgi:hypothetical protein